MVAGGPWVLGASMAADGNPQVLRHPWVLWEPVGTRGTHCFRPIVLSHGRQGWARRQSSLPSQEEAPAPRFPLPDKELGGASRRERSWLLFLTPNCCRCFTPCAGDRPWAPGRSSPAWLWPGWVSKVSPQRVGCCTPWGHHPRRAVLLFWGFEAGVFHYSSLA